jgi:hypothetical protein
MELLRKKAMRRRNHSDAVVTDAPETRRSVVAVHGLMQLKVCQLIRWNSPINLKTAL